MADDSAAGGRAIAYATEAVDTPEGEGASVRRAIPLPGVGSVDPFLLLDEFTVAPPAGFPVHPHRGFEILTYMFSGAFAHGDSAGNQVVLEAGGLQKITTGRGMEHSEAPVGPEECRGLQLWINLARADKGVPPDYEHLAAADIPVTRGDGVTVRELAGGRSPVRLHTPALYLDVELTPGATFEHAIPIEWQGFAYVLSGGGVFGANTVSAAPGVVLAFGPGTAAGGSGDADALRVRAGEAPLRFVLGAARPHREPVRWRGPFVD